MPLVLERTRNKKKPESQAVVQHLSEVLQARQQQLQQLQDERQQLLFEQSLLQAFCANLSWFRQHLAASNGFALDELLSDEELTLLEHLHGSRVSASGDDNDRGSGMNSMPDMDSSCQQPPHPANLAVAAATPAAAAGAGQQQRQQGGNASSNLSGAHSSGPHSTSASMSHLSSHSSNPDTPADDSRPPGNTENLYRYLAVRPFQGAAVMSTADIMADYAATIRELALNLSLHQAQQRRAAATAAPAAPAAAAAARPVAGSTGGAGLSPSPLQRIRDLMCRHMHLMTTLALTGRGKEIMELCLTNIDTGALISAPDLEHHRRLLPVLQLTHQQELNIAQGIGIFHRLEAMHRHSFQQLVNQEGGSSSSSSSSIMATSGSGGSSSTSSSAPAVGPSAAKDTASTAAGGRASSGKAQEAAGALGGEAATAAAAKAKAKAAAKAAGNTYEALMEFGKFMDDPEYAKQLHSNHRLMSKLRLQLQKEFHIRLCFALTLYGCLDWVQLAKLHVHCYPYLPTPPVLCQVVAEHVQQQRQQQQQQRRQQQQQQLHR